MTEDYLDGDKLQCVCCDRFVDWVDKSGYCSDCREMYEDPYDK